LIFIIKYAIFIISQKFTFDKRKIAYFMNYIDFWEKK
jgi:hypothetical protein